MIDRIMSVRKSTQAGFTLAELAVVMIISGMLMLGLAHFLYISNQRAAYTHTADALSTSAAAILEFAALSNGAYPCPANPALRPDNPQYGVSDCTLPTVPGRAADDVAGGDPVYIGVMPVTSLLPLLENVEYTGRLAVDGWGNKITYAVSANLTSAATYDDLLGAISVVDEFDQNILNAPGTAHAVLISHGPNGIGAFPAGGTVPNPGCDSVTTPLPPTPGFVPPIIDEKENCDYDDAKFLSGLKRENQNNFNDDELTFLINSTTSLWEYVDGNPEAIRNTNPGFVGVGVHEPQQKLHVAGDIRADFVAAQDLCQGDTDECMPLSTLAGVGISCPNPNEAIVAIENNSVVSCHPIVYNASTIAPCAAGTIAVGFSTDSRLICEPRP